MRVSQDSIRRSAFRCCWLPLQVVAMIVGWMATGAVADMAVPASELSLISPVPWQVIQRIGGDSPSRSQIDGTAASTPSPLGSARMTIRGQVPNSVTELSDIQFRAQLTDRGHGRSTEWKTVSRREILNDSHEFEIEVIVAAGGWYRVEVRAADAVTGEILTAEVSPVGVGEVFLVAGQSYATNTNDEQLRVRDSAQRVVAFNSANGTWAVAHDPQPAPDGSDGGSIWPAAGDLLIPQWNVPVAFANVAVGGTSSAQWMPDGELHSRLVAAGKVLGRFRAVLWQQGESDVIAGTTTEDYVANLQKIRHAAIRLWGFEPPWLLAKSTHHPTVYADSEGEARIRAAVDQLSLQSGFGIGPDTDTLTGENRGGPQSRRHFTAIGQQRAAEMWSSLLIERWKSGPSRLEAASFLLPDLHLMEPVWNSEIIHRESSILLVPEQGAAAEARLAFPVQQILSVTSADQSYAYDIARDVELTEDRLRLVFHQRGPVEGVSAADLFVPADADNSYRHRTGFPDQNLLYRPGHWFHDRNVEITYRPDPENHAASNIPLIAGSLPRTLARLKSGSPLTIGISGDSISTGLDASALTSAPPFQPGFPELVVAQLRVLSDSEVVLKNRAVSGWSIANGNEDLDQLLAEKPDLILVAYGMNDVGRRNPALFALQTETLIQRIQLLAPETDILLISSMLGNSEWVHTPRDMFAAYQEELRRLVQPGVALADVTELWRMLSRHKHDLDYTGNGLNHPNDFGHRLYAQLVLHALTLE